MPMPQYLSKFGSGATNIETRPIKPDIEASLGYPMDLSLFVSIEASILFVIVLFTYWVTECPHLPMIITRHICRSNLNTNK